MPTLISLTSRGLLGLSGPDAEGFLQGQITQNLRRLDAAHALFGAHLTPQGRFLYDFFIFRLGGHVVLDVARDELMPLAKTLHHYKTRERVEFDDLSADYTVHALLHPSDGPAQRGDLMAVGNGVLYRDPRHLELGHRLVTPVGAPLPVDGTPADEATYHAHRLGLGIPDGRFDGEKGQTPLNELCYADLGGIDYTKGCYVGQELTARTHFRTQPKKRLFALTFQGTPPAAGTPILADGHEAGTLFSSAGKNAVGLLRLTEVAKNPALTCGGVALTARKPDWATYSLTAEAKAPAAG
jgi:folate-binding protein YgfZ